MLSIELGWFFAEFGRQPWILYGLMRTSEAATTSGAVGWMFILFFILYIVLGTVTISVLVKMFKKNPVQNELEQHTKTGESYFEESSNGEGAAR